MRWLSRFFCILKPLLSSKPRLALRDAPYSLVHCLMRLSNCRPPVELAAATAIAAGLIIANGSLEERRSHRTAPLTRGLPLGCRLGQCNASSLAPLSS